MTFRVPAARLSLTLMLALLTIPAATVAEIPVTLHDQILIPDSIYTNKFSIVDLDQDGETELLLENEAIIARYSLLNQQTLDYFEKPESDKPRKFACGFVDEDSGLDFIEVIMLGIHEYGINRLVAVPYLSTNCYLAGDSTELLQFEDVTSIWIPEPPYPNMLGQWGFGDQYFADDGTDNMRMWGDIRFGYTIIDDYIDPWYEEGLLWYKITYSYIPGEAAAETGVSLPPFNGHYIFPNDPAPTTVLFESFDYWVSRLTYCHGELQIKSYDVRIYSGPDLSASHRFSSLCYCAWQTWNDQFCSAQRILTLKAHTAGDFLSDSPGYEFVVCESHYGWNSDGCYCSEYHLRCFDLSDPETLSEEWDLLLDISEQDIKFLFSEPSFPDQFFAFAHSKVISRNADGGAVMDSSAAIESEAGDIIAYRSLESDGINYVILRNDNLLSLYHLDIGTDTPDVPPDGALPARFTLGEPYPNPFNAQLTIPVSLDRQGDLSVDIYNLLGQKVANIHQGPAQPGNLVFSWDGKNENGQDVSSGIYLIRAATGSASGTVKAVLIK